MGRPYHGLPRLTLGSITLGALTYNEVGLDVLHPPPPDDLARLPVRAHRLTFQAPNPADLVRLQRDAGLQDLAPPPPCVDQQAAFRPEAFAVRLDGRRPRRRAARRGRRG